MKFWIYKWRNSSIRNANKKTKPNLAIKTIIFALTLSAGIIGILSGGVRILCYIALCFSLILLIQIILGILRKF